MKNTLNPIRIIMILFALLQSGIQVWAQNVKSGIIPDTPPSPQAVAFNRLGDYQVNNNYGAPDINIPLFEIDFHGYRIPLTLHYEASPLKPGYNYDVTGLGWTLSGNSCVSRTIKDRADEYGLFNNPFELDSFRFPSGQSVRYKDYSDNLDKLNFQYDSYNIVLPSGRSIPFFMYKSNGVMVYRLMPLDSNVKIECNYESNLINGFMVTDENGVVYHFTVADKATSIFENDVNALRNVTWLLTSINIPAKGLITYQYTDLQTIDTYTTSEPVIRVSRFMSQLAEDTEEKRLCVTKTLHSQNPKYKMRFLRSISYGPTTVEFNYAHDGAHMSEIVVNDCGKIIRKITLDMNSWSSIRASLLKSLVISGQDNNNKEDKLVYGFDYSGASSRENYTDYWGNVCESNGKKDLGNFNMYIDNVGIDEATIQNQLEWDLNPAVVIDNKPEDYNYYFKIKLQSTPDGETRQASLPKFHNVLTSITYPNGGRTSFNYENHRFPTATAADGDLIFERRNQRIIEGGGFRIESITNWAADGTASTDYYRYGFTYEDILQQNFPLPLPENYNIKDHIGCGEAVVDPNLLTFMNYSHATDVRTPLEFQKMVVGLPSAFKDISEVHGKATWWDAEFSANQFRALLGGRRPVVYPEITVYHGHPYIQDECKSKTVYKYDIYSYGLDYYTHYLSAIRHFAPDTAYFEPVYYNNNRPGLRPMENPAQRHQLKSKSDYSYNSNSGKWELISEEKYSYKEESLEESGYMFDSDISRGRGGRYTIQLGVCRPLEDLDLFEFYSSIKQKQGRSTLTGKITTTLRQGGTRTKYNTLNESWGYKYWGVPEYRYYSEQIKNRDSYTYDKKEFYSYTEEDNETGVLKEMQDRNMLAFLTSTELYSEKWDSTISGSKIDYASYDNCILPSKLYERNGEQYEESIEVLSYDSYGNPTEIVDLKTGIHSIYLWDLYGRYLIAAIKNATLSQVGNISQLSEENSIARHATLKSLLPNAQIQTWDYKPLIGPSSFTDVNGQTIHYEYDGLGRLKSEKRMVNGMPEVEPLREYEYNYLNE